MWVWARHAVDYDRVEVTASYALSAAVQLAPGAGFCGPGPGPRGTGPGPAWPRIFFSKKLLARTVTYVHA